MIIGVDMDNTICSTSEKILEYEKEFLLEKHIDSTKLWEDTNLKEEFLNKYLEKVYAEALPKSYVKDTLDKLKQKGNKIYIITARSERYVDDIYDVIKNYLQKNNLVVDEIFINGKDKVDVCLKEKINLMIEDSRYNYDKLVNNGIHTILFDENNNNLDIDNRVSSWQEIISKIEEII